MYLARDVRFVALLRFSGHFHIGLDLNVVVMGGIDSNRLKPILTPAGRVDEMHPASRPAGDLATLVRPNRLSCRFVVRPKRVRVL
jgi:hypothetical protein